MTSVQRYDAWSWASARYKSSDSLLGNFQYIQDFLANLVSGQVLYDRPRRRSDMAPHFYNHLEQSVWAQVVESHIPQLTLLRYIQATSSHYRVLNAQAFS